MDWMKYQTERKIRALIRFPVYGMPNFGSKGLEVAVSELKKRSGYFRILRTDSA